MNWRERQRKEREDREADAQQATTQRLGQLMGFEDPEPDQDPLDDLVGWMDFQAGNVKGLHHCCIECSPTLPGPSMVVVYRRQLAATMPCTKCGRTLEGIGR